jgi:putative acetyltransferase
MDPLILEAPPTDPAVLPLIERHLTLMYASSPACSVHAMDAASLAGAGARFFVVFDSGEAVAMGSVKRLSETHGEVK